MDELDPTERVEFERRLRSDPDLLIEVECMKSTLFKMENGVTTAEAPQDVVQAVRQKASREVQKRRYKNLIQTNTVRYAAAILLLGFTFVLGINYNTATDASVENVQANVNNQQAVSGSAVLPSNAVPQTHNATRAVTPQWSDKNDVLDINRVNSSSISGDEFDSITLQNAKKLRLLNTPVIDQPMSDDIMLTRMPANR